MSDLNQCNFIGRLGKDLEPLKYSPSGTAIAEFSLAVGYKYKDTEHTEWVRITAFGKLAEICGEYLTKGKQVFISGRLQTDSWEDREGNKRYTTKVVANQMQMLGEKAKSGTAEKANEVPDDDIPWD
jgi:single-strand DNA-binding protein